MMIENYLIATGKYKEYKSHLMSVPPNSTLNTCMAWTCSFHY